MPTDDKNKRGPRPDVTSSTGPNPAPNVAPDPLSRGVGTNPTMGPTVSGPKVAGPKITGTGDVTSTTPPDIGTHTAMGDTNLGTHYPVPGEPVGPTGMDRPPEGGRRDVPSGKDVAKTVKQTGNQAADSVKNVASEINETTDQLAALWDQASPWLRDQVQARPVGMAVGAFAGGYILAHGIPRVLIRTGVKIGIPMALIFYMARRLSSMDVHDREDVWR